MRSLRSVQQFVFLGATLLGATHLVATLSLSIALWPTCAVAIELAQLDTKQGTRPEWAPQIARVLPPVGIEMPAERLDGIKRELSEVQSLFNALMSKGTLTAGDSADIEAFTKAIQYALLHNEFYDPKDADKANLLLQEAKRRLASVQSNERPWRRATGLVVRSYRSIVDRSAQPYGLVIPQNHDFSQPCPLYIWLHGRGDKQTDMHFISERMQRPGQISPPNSLVLHPFGRHCVAFKFAGEQDVLEAVKHVTAEYSIDPRRIVLMGFSMGGAGAWHLGAHYASHWTAVSPGAGFAETARYRQLKPEQFPASYEQTLWGLYDTPAYTRSLFNVPVIAYSGELDRQIQAARIMEEAFTSEGRTLPHLIGPGVEHKYEPNTLQELLNQIGAIVTRGKNELPTEVFLQTRTLRYPRQAWVEVESLQKHWSDTRVEGKIVGEKRLSLTTKNVQSIRLTPWPDMRGAQIEIDGQVVKVVMGTATNAGHRDAGHRDALLAKVGNQWQESEPKSDLRKRTLLQGPIDDAFVGPAPFVVVRPKSTGLAELDRWCQFEFQHFVDRWRALMRGDAVVIDDESVDAYLGTSNIVVWGNPSSNGLLARLNGKLPVNWQANSWDFGGQRYDAHKFVPMLVYPNPLNRERYVVVNSGITFREGHDSTNSNQTPKLPDWAIVDFSQVPDAQSPGKIAAAGFFDESWGFNK